MNAWKYLRKDGVIGTQTRDKEGKREGEKEDLKFMSEWSQVWSAKIL